jgi:hypothetical protein
MVRQAVLETERFFARLAKALEKTETSARLRKRSALVGLLKGCGREVGTVQGSRGWHPVFERGWGGAAFFRTHRR